MDSGSAELGYMSYPYLYLRNTIDGKSKAFDKVQDSDKNDFKRKARAAILILALRPRGKEILDKVCGKLAQINRGICIEPSTDRLGRKGSGWDESEFVIRWWPDEIDDPGDWDQLNSVPPFIILGHEFVHAMHTLFNDVYRVNDNVGIVPVLTEAVEEARTIGLGPWADHPLTENGLRQEWAIRLRKTFGDATPDCLLKGTFFGTG